MKIDTNGWSTSDILEAARKLVSQSRGIIDCGCSLDQDEPDFADDLRLSCKEYCQAFDQRFHK